MISTFPDGLSAPILAAPMAGGPTSPALVVAAANAGGMGLLAGGYRSTAALADQISAVRGAADRFGVNLFAPNPVPVEPHAYRRYRDALRADAERCGVELPEIPREDDDAWRDKIDLLLDSPVPLVSFTFAIPAADVVSALKRAGTLVAQTVTA